MRILYKWRRKHVCSRHFKADFNNKMFSMYLTPRKQKSLLKPITSFVKNKASKSTYSRAFFEKQRFKVYYGIPREKKFKKIAISAGTKNFISFMESRLDILIWRLNFSFSLSKLRIFIQKGLIFVNGHCETNFERILKPGDEINFIRSNFYFQRIFIHNMLYMSIYNELSFDPRYRFFCFNSYLEFSPSTCTFILVKRPTEKDVYIPFKYSADLLGDLYHPNMKLNPRRF